MSNYPGGYPENRLIVNGVDLTVVYQMILVDGFTLAPPEPKLYTVEIPGGNGVIDLTESLSGDVVYNNREQDFVFKLIYPNDFEYVKTKLSNFLHGKFYEYKLTWDQEYTYKGRFSVSAYSHIGLAKGKLGEIVVHVSADPYKYLEDRVYSINGSGGEVYYFPSGRKPVRPIIQTVRSANIVWKGNTYRVGAGAYRLNFVLFEEGINELYINTLDISSSDWDDVVSGGSGGSGSGGGSGGGGTSKLTWEEARKYTWDQLARINLITGNPTTVSEYLLKEENRIVTFTESPDEEKPYDPKDKYTIFMTAYKWQDLLSTPDGDTWQTIKDKKWTWDGLNYDPGSTGNGGTTGSGSWGGSTGAWGGGNSMTEWDYGKLPNMGGAIAVISYEWGDL